MAYLCRTRIRQGQPASLFEELNQVVHNHLALLIASHHSHEHLEQSQHRMHLLVYVASQKMSGRVKLYYTE